MTRLLDFSQLRVLHVSFGLSIHIQETGSQPYYANMQFPYRASLSLHNASECSETPEYTAFYDLLELTQSVFVFQQFKSGSYGLGKRTCGRGLWYEPGTQS